MLRSSWRGGTHLQGPALGLDGQCDCRDGTDDAHRGEETQGPDERSAHKNLQAKEHQTGACWCGGLALN